MRHIAHVVLLPLLEAELTRLTVAQILSGRTKNHYNSQEAKQKLSHSYTVTEIKRTNTIQEVKHSLNISGTVAVLGRTVSSPPPQNWTFDFSCVLSTFSRDTAGDLAWCLLCVGIIYEQ